MEHISKPVSEGGCGAWCCQTQNPQVLYVEFRNAWNNVQENWSDQDIIELVRRSLRAYLFASERDGCVFWDRETKMCSHHETRPFNCRVYGITPEEEWRPRYERLKVIYPDTREQCNLVSTADGSEFTKKKSDSLWNMLKNAEKTIGVRPSDIHDDFGGSYRRYYEHVILHLMGDEGMEMLSQVREHGSNDEKEGVIKAALDGLIKMKETANVGATSDDSDG